MQSSWQGSAQERKEEKILSSTKLLNEARDLIDRSRASLASLETNETTRKGNKQMTTTVTPQQAAALYTAGKSVVEVAQELGITYGKARKLISASGTEIRNTSDRLKGKTRKSK
jgi:hypothetical protein